MSVRVTIEVDFYSGALQFEANDSASSNYEPLSDRIKRCTAQAEASAIAAIQAHGEPRA